VVADSGATNEGFAKFDIHVRGSDFHGTLAMAGAHHAFNAAASIGVCVALGLDVEPFVERMQTTTGSEWRMDVHVGTFTVINDAYNANPQSIAAAFETLAAMPGRSFAVVGPMAELGPVCEQQHRLMGELARKLRFEKLIIVGPDHGYALGAHDIALRAADIDAARDTLTAILEPRDVVLVKASRTAGLERLALQLIKEAAQ
jgi:UDP-N-acetylmuramoyl-tripeptide--D-alanyl-D-alanine ligase